MIIRNATMFDHTGILECLIRWLDEGSVDYPPPTSALGYWISKVLRDGYVLVIEEDGKIVGTIGMSYTHFPWNDKMWIMNNEWLHILTENRANGVADKLIKLVKEYADNRKMPIRFDVMNDKDVDKKDRFIQMKGARYVGGNFIYGLGGK